MSRIPVTEEVIVEKQLQAAMLFDPYDWRDMARVIRRGIEHRDDLLAMQQAAYATLADRTWQNVSRETIQALDAAAGQGAPQPKGTRRSA